MNDTGIEITTTETIPGEEIAETLGVVTGNTVRNRNLETDFKQSLRRVTSGEFDAYSDLLGEAREDALDRMLAEADRMNADAVVNVRFDTSAIDENSAEVLAYGTAVRVR